jgi:RNA polymerase sigma-70 factor (ECF subfamily)
MTSGSRLAAGDSQMDDTALLTAIADGDSAALRELFERHAPWVAARLRRTLPAHAVEDVVQETFIAVWRGARKYGGEGVVGAWIWGIARRQAALWARSNGRRVSAIDDVASDTAAGHDVEATAVRGVDLAAAMASLGPEGGESRELVRLVYVEDRPLDEVGNLLGIPTGTVKSRLFRARQVLRAALKGDNSS